MSYIDYSAVDKIEKLENEVERLREEECKQHNNITKLMNEIERLQTLADTRDMMLRQLRAQFDDMVRQRDAAIDKAEAK